jgi:hypothetical protein
MSEDDRSWHSRHRQPRRSSSDDAVSPIVSILLTIFGIVIMVAVVLLTVTTMIK